MSSEAIASDAAPDDGERRRALLLAGIAIAATFAVFAPILYYMVLHWRAVEDYSHGFLIAPLALYFAFERRRKLKRTPIEPSWWGLLPLAIATLSLTVGRLGVELMTMRAAFVFTLIGAQILLLGLPMFKVLAFPLLFLFLMVPLPQSLVNIVTFPLQLIAADLAVSSLQFFSLPVMREGNIIHLPNSPLFVAEACSGLRSLMALGTLGIVFAYFFRKSWLERTILVLSTIPIAVLVNSFRVALTGVLTYRYGPQMAEGAIHQTEGFFTFGMAFALLMLEATFVSWLLARYRARRAPA